MAPASLTKLMTAYEARRILQFRADVVFSKEAEAVEEKRSGVATGEVFSRDAAVELALVPSANDAALALAEAAGAKMGGGSFDEKIALFVERMNAQAKEMGLANTHFENPAGLDSQTHKSTAQDLARIAEEIIRKDPAMLEITREPEVHVTSRAGKIYTQETTDELLKEFPALLGGKTGMTDAAGGALLLLYPTRPNHTAIIIILKSDDRFGDGRKIIRWLEANCLASRGDSGERPCEP